MADAPKRGFLATLAAAATEIANGIDTAAGGETELGKKIRKHADSATSIDASIRASKEAYDHSATRELVDMATEHRKKNLAKNGSRRSLLRSERVSKQESKR